MHRVPLPEGGPRPPARRGFNTPALVRHRRRLRRHGSAGAGRRLAGGIAVSLMVLAGLGASVGGGAALAVVAMAADGLPDPTVLERLAYPQPTIVYDRTGTVELGRFQAQDRRVITFEEVPDVVIAATTTAEDRTFWENPGFDPAAIASAIIEQAGGGEERGASTITQQLVRARLLPATLTAPGADIYRRKISEIFQAARVTAAHPGREGKERIVTAYLNQIYYGHDAYGLASAASVYFGVTDLEELTAAQAALLAGLPKSPSNLDPYRYAASDADGRLVVDPASPPMERRDYILEGMAESGLLTPGAAAEAKAEPAVLAGDRPIRYRAAHLMWRVREQLIEHFGSLEAVGTGGYRVITTLDWDVQRIGERYVTAAAVMPHLGTKAARRMARELELSKRDRRWAEALRNRGPHNGALVTLDYRTGDVLAYVGSAGYERDDLRSRRFSPKFDVLAQGYRQPGSAFKPVVYAAGFESRELTPGSLLVDVTTRFARGWAPHDADRRERGPVLVREALQQSLNIPAIRAYGRVGDKTVAETAARLGITFAGGEKRFRQAGLSAGIGTVEVRPLDLAAAYGALANGGRLAPPRMILEIRGPDGATVWEAGKPEFVEAISPGTAFLVSDILAGNTNPRENPIWGPILQIRTGKGGAPRPAAAKTGTTNDTRDFATYGYFAPPADPDAPAYVTGVWMGNSDHSRPEGRGSREVISLDGPGRIWQAVMRDLSKGLPMADFEPPEDVVQARIDRWTGGRPGNWTRDTRQEWFLKGTQPGGKRTVDKSGLMYVRSCGGWRIDLTRAEPVDAWQGDVRDWMARAARGAGRVGRYGTATAYLPGRSSWGGGMAGPCAPKPERSGESPVPSPPGNPDPGPPGPQPDPTPGPDPTPSGG